MRIQVFQSYETFANENGSSEVQILWGAFTNIRGLTQNKLVAEEL